LFPSKMVLGKALLLSVLLLATVSIAARTDREYWNEFTTWMKTHQKSYSHTEFRRRFSIWRENLDFIESFNEKKQGFSLAMNIFGDLQHEEFRALYLGFNGEQSKMKEPLVQDSEKLSNDQQMAKSLSDSIGLPESWDWRKNGSVTPVKNQGQCGSCWAFSTTGSVEGCHHIKTGHLVSLSEQNLMDCSSSYGNKGCNGGLMTYAMQYIIDNGGVDTEASYPYEGSDGTCRFNKTNVGATLSSFVNVKRQDEADLQQKVYQGPTSIAMDASHPTFQFYHSGVYSNILCSSRLLDHGVLAVGWGTDSSEGKYWIVKNSWGTTWGNEGYFWIARDDGNMCGVATTSTLPIC